MKSTKEENDECEICEMEKLPIEELLELAKVIGIHYDKNKLKTIEDYQIIDDLMTSGKVAELRKELFKSK
jgi:hypothetical protein